ncbi:MAG: M28 family peptidase [Bacteroidales bacterium]|jgi:hypothetical protein|nr:M28 family peptidase [Bacteroidales bacterium]
MIVKSRLFVISLLLLITSILTLGYFWLPSPKDSSSKSFSAIRVSEDIRVISREPHSVDNAEARERVRLYLSERLKDIGFHTEVEYYDTIGNVYATLPPISSHQGDSSSYVLLMAHLDSRFANMVNERLHYSLGAADDGYGLGVILELARNSIEYRERWSQGVKILFTDSEEKNLEGMRMALKYRSDFLSDVGLIINLEARGVKGPALLFETSPGNSRIMELYRDASIPAGYSLSSFVYGILPNYTDFSLIKNEFAGINFAVIDNLDYYHTELDNFENISLSSIQHYGEQLAPIVKSYLTEKRYSDLNYMKAGEDLVFFTIPFIGLVSFTSNGYLFLNIIIMLSFILNVIYLIKNKRVSLRKCLISSIIIFSITLILAIIGFLVSQFLALINNADYKFIALAHLKYDNILSILVFVISFIIIYLAYKRLISSAISSKIDFQVASEFLLFIISLVSFIFIRENFFILIPLIYSLLSRSSYNFKQGWVLILLLSILLLLITVPFVHTIYLALYTGAISIPLTIMVLVFFVLIPSIHRVSTKLAKSD